MRVVRRVCELSGLLYPHYIESKVFCGITLRKHLCTASVSCESSRGYKGTSTDTEEAIDIEALFLDQRVRHLLKQLTGLNMEKVFRPVQMKLNVPVYKFLTDDQLQQAMVRAKSTTRILLQMPPVMKERKEITEVLSKDSDIQGFDTCKFLFTDTTVGISNRQRFIVARDTDGTLRKASWEERHRMNECFFPSPHVSMEMPKMFEEKYLEEALNKECYEFILDRACIQFDPDDPEYIRVTRRTYSHIDATKSFDNLHSTRHFGPLVFHLAVTKRIDNLLLDVIQKKRIDDAVTLVHLYHLCHPKCQSAQNSEPKADGLTLIKGFIAHNANKRSTLELALQTYEEMARQEDQVEEGVKQAHGHA